jgi:cysteine desulfurase
MVGSVVASHVLLAMGLPIDRARSAVRFSLGKWTTAEEVKAAGEAVHKIVERLHSRQSAYAVA